MSKQSVLLIFLIVCFGALGIIFWGVGPIANFNKAVQGNEIASQSPFAAYVVKNYKDCLHPGFFSSGTEAQCKVTVAQLVRLEKGDASVQEAMHLMDAYEQNKLRALGVPPSKQ